MSTARGRGEARSEPAATCRAGFRPRLLSRTGPSSEETSGPSAAPHPGNQSVRQRGLAGVLNRLRVTSRGRGLQGCGAGGPGLGARQGRTGVPGKNAVPAPGPAPGPAEPARRVRCGRVRAVGAPPPPETFTSLSFCRRVNRFGLVCAVTLVG